MAHRRREPHRHRHQGTARWRDPQGRWRSADGRTISLPPAEPSLVWQMVDWAARSCPGALVEDAHGRLLCEYGSACRVAHLIRSPARWIARHRDLTLSETDHRSDTEQLFTEGLSAPARQVVVEACRRAPAGEVTVEALVRVLVEPCPPSGAGGRHAPVIPAATPPSTRPVAEDEPCSLGVVLDLLTEARHRTPVVSPVPVEAIAAVTLDHVVLRGLSVPPGLLLALTQLVLGDRAPRDRDELTLLCHVCRQFGTRPSDLEGDRPDRTDRTEGDRGPS